MSTVSRKKNCADCDKHSWYHALTWLDELITNLVSPPAAVIRLEPHLDLFLGKLFVLLNLGRWREDFLLSHIPLLRTLCFIREARQRQITCRLFYGPSGYTNHLQIVIDSKKFHFESLPLADGISRYDHRLTNNKEIAKQHLKQGGFPIAEGRSFWFWQKRTALRYGAGLHGLPLVVKPLGGSASRHVTTAIKNTKELQTAIKKALAYSPRFMIERYLPDSFVHRATVIDFDFVACVKQIPAHVTGNGSSTIRQLIDEKNTQPNRQVSSDREYLFHPIVEDAVTSELLRQQGHTLSSIPPRNQIVYLQQNSFLKLGGDLAEVTPEMHPDNRRLFQAVAKWFDIRIVGIDFVALDIARSWKVQPCAILELNSLPSIELHHFPSVGQPQNIAGALVNLLFKYYR